MKKLVFILLAAAVILPVVGTVAQAGGREPGSLLVFPLYDSRAGMATLITVTNTHPSQDVWVEYRYIDGRDCSKSDRSEWLSPRDTLTVIAGTHNFDQNQGFVYVYAKADITDPSPIVHNWLVGQASAIDGIRVLEASYNAYAFNGIGHDGDLTDIDGDEILDMDGAEYEMAADFYIQPRFVGQADRNYPGFLSDIVLINLTGGKAFTAEINFDIWNDNEAKSSATWEFTCWDRKTLMEISGAFSATNMKYQDDDDEIIGFPELEAGWFEVHGIVANSDCDSIDDPAILHLLTETTGKHFAGADLPFESAEKQDNGDLLPRGCFGDP